MIFLQHTSAYVSIRQHTSAYLDDILGHKPRLCALLLSLYQGAIQALLSLYQGAIKARFKRYSGAIKALFRRN
jgi:hypothetical protein